MCRKITYFASILIGLLFVFNMGSYSQENLVTYSIQWLETNQDVSGYWGIDKQTPFRDATVVLEVLSSFDVDSAVVNNGFNAIYSDDIKSIDYMSRKLIAICSHGYSIPSYLQDTLVNWQNFDGGWGYCKYYSSNNLDALLALKALKVSSYSSTPVLQSGINYLINNQNIDGGWSFIAGDSSRVFFSAHALIVLSMYSNDFDVSTPIQNGVNWLKSQIDGDNGFGTGGSNAYETGLALAALVLNDPVASEIADAQDYLESTQLPDGSWNNDAYSTALAIYGLNHCGPDLAIDTSDIQFSNPSPPDSELVTISATIRNLGIIGTDSILVQVYDGHPDTGGVQIETDIFIDTLGPGNDNLILVDWDTYELAGDHDIFVVIDSADSIFESDETNNMAYKSIHVRYPPDLYIADTGIVFDPPYPQLDDSVTIYTTIWNIGEDTASDISFQLWDGDPDSSGIPLLGSPLIIPSLNPNSYVTINLDMEDYFSSGGIFEIYACADINDEIREIYEFNNCNSDSLIVGSDSVPPVISCPPDETSPITVGLMVSHLVTATDYNGDSIIITAENTTADFVFTDSGNGVAYFEMTATAVDIGLNTVRFIASDGVLADTCYWSVTVGSQVAYIDFETLPNGTPTTDSMLIYDQYSNPIGVDYVGVTLYLSDDGVNPNGNFPRIAKVGSQLTAFHGPEITAPECGVVIPTYQNMPATDYQDLVECSFITDHEPGIPSWPYMIIDYDSSVTVAGGILLDVDNDEVWEIKSYLAQTEVGSPVVIQYTDPGTGDGIATPWEVNVTDGFDRLVFHHTGSTAGLAFDNFYTSSLPPSLCDTFPDAIFCEDFEDGTFDQWNIILGDWEIVDTGSSKVGHLLANSLHFRRVVSIDTMPDNVIIEAILMGNCNETYDTAADIAISFWGDSLGEQYYFVALGGGSSGDALVLVYRDGLAGGLIAENDTVKIVNNIWYRVKIELMSNRIRVKRWEIGSPEPEEWHISYSDATPFGNHIGIGLLRGQNLDEEGWFDNIVVTALPACSILATSPIQNELNVDANTNITIMFNTNIDTTTLNDSSLIVYAISSGLHSGTLNYNELTKTTIFDPDVDFFAGEIVTVILTDDIKSTDDISLENSYSWSFIIDVDDISPGVFSYTEYYPVGNGPHDIFARDFNADGLIDLLTDNYYSNSVTILFNNSGTFSTPYNYSVGSNPHDSYTGDIDLDGYCDIIVPNWGDQTISVLLNNGDSTFTTDSVYAVGFFSKSTYIADINGDVFPDLVVGNSSSYSISIFINNGDGSFSSSGNYSVANDPWDIYSVDIDNDGDNDLAVACGDYSVGAQEIAVLYNDGSGDFDFLLSNPVGQSPGSVLSADLNGDGNNDLVSANMAAHTVSVLINNGDGTFGEDIEYPVGVTGTYSPRSVYIADFDGDEDLDISASNRSDSSVSVLLNDGFGVFSLDTSYAVFGGPRGIAAADFDNDGDIDIATANVDSNLVTILINDTLTSKGKILAYVTPDSNGFEIDRALYDDGLPQILGDYGYSITVTDRNVIPELTPEILSNYDQLWIFTTNPNSPGCFSQSEIDAILDYRTNGNGLLIATDHDEFQADANQISVPLGVTFYGNVNHDGPEIYPDFTEHLLFEGVESIFGHTSEGIISITGNASVVATYQGDNLIAVVDEDCGRVVFDVCCVRCADDDEYYGGPHISVGDTPQYFKNIADWLMCNSPQVLSTYPSKNENGIGFNTLISVEFDRDMEPATVNNTTFKVYSSLFGEVQGVYAYDSSDFTINFNSANDFIAGDEYTVILTTDIRSNHEISLDSSYIWSFKVGVNENSPGMFRPKDDYTANSSPSDLIVTDIDNDLDIDIITSNFGSDNISVIKNEGSNNYATSNDYVTGVKPRKLYAIDINSDDFLDIITVNSDSSGISILENDGTGVYSSTSTINTGFIPYSVAGIDISGDGLLDLAVSNADSNYLAIYINNGAGFDFLSNVTVGSGPLDVVVLDADKDADLDIVTVNSRSNDLSIMENDRNGNFTAYSLSTLSHSPNCIETADLDGDQNMDLIVGCGNTNSVLVYKGQASIYFTLDRTYSVGDWPSSIRCIDYDGDQDLDLAVSNKVSNSVEILSNNGDGSFDLGRRLYSVGLNPSSIIAVDIDSDTDVDIISANAQSDNISILLNEEYICADSDEDGFGDPGNPDNECPDDNCPEISNPDQQDTDADGIGDVCDPCTDSDGDGFGDPGLADTCLTDNCPGIANPDQEDYDNDGIGDSCDVCPEDNQNECCAPLVNNLPPEIQSALVDTVAPGDSIIYMAIVHDPNCNNILLDCSFINIPSWCDTNGLILKGFAECNYFDTTFLIAVSDGELTDTQEVLIKIDLSNLPPEIYNLYGDTIYAYMTYEFIYYPDSIIDYENDVIDWEYIEIPSWSDTVNDTVSGIPPYDTACIIEPLSLYAYDYCNADTLSHTLFVKVCGDVNDDCRCNIFDITYLIAYLYLDGSAPIPETYFGDVNSDEVINIFDITFLISYLYLNGSPPECIGNY